MKKHITLAVIVLIVGILCWAGALFYVFGEKTGLNDAEGFFSSWFSREEEEVVVEEETEYASENSYEKAIIEAVDRVMPSVVAITVSKNVPIIENCRRSLLNDLPSGLEDFFGNIDFSVPCETGTALRNVGGGSGFVVTSDGLIVTNKHVVEDASASYTVITFDGSKYKAEVVAVDPIQDIAVIRIGATGLPVAPLGNSDGVRLGQTVIAIGNSLAEFRNTVSVGIISGLGRNVSASNGGGTELLEGVIQTDAAINPGNSGGPLINLKGEVIGINAAVVSEAQSIGFALPINAAKRDVASVRATGEIKVPFLGVRYQLITDELQEVEDLPVNYGAIIRGFDGQPAIVADSPADKAGLHVEDIILAVNGVRVEADRSLLSLVQRYSVGDIIQLSVIREGVEVTIPVLLEERR